MDTADRFDAFVAHASALVMEHWKETARREYSDEEKQRMEACMSVFFSDFRYAWFFNEDRNT